ncbi:hypothetical protein GGS23DRAFT_93466 [Durotheca rogersii]|uniref:uncharacterized protein n=1 Tax=Durotheca rogersii TaxID=419775 RepID=UPI0022209640|nr:uncharacterized protein GGS23DRAFT_93466 [Durotheca rogersii]KAI5862328.1 hypothetical protein GGS23DRAFT_93466 [Durotheca rogersii]
MSANGTKTTKVSKPAQVANPAPSRTSRKRKMDPDAQKYYAVRAGFKPGVYLTWPECQKQTAGYRDKSFLSRKDAEAYVAGKKTSVTAPGEERYYAVAIGREPGVYTDWDKASLAIKGWKGPKYKRFDTREEAIEYIRIHGNEAAQEALLQYGGEVPSKKRKTTKSNGASLVAEDEPDVQHIYTDGSSLSNGKPGAAAGVGVYFGKDDER